MISKVTLFIRIPLVAVVLGAGATLLYTMFGSQLIMMLAGPPQVVMTEAYMDAAVTGKFNHAVFDQLLHKHVSEGGWVDYAGISKDRGDLEQYMEAVASADFESLGRDEKLAFLINAYNAATILLIVEHYPVDSIKDIPGSQRWEAKRWAIAGGVYSLNEIEHVLIRPNFAEPRIHFALVCAAIGCPPLRAEAYTGDALEEQLRAQTNYVHSNKRWLEIGNDGTSIQLTPLYLWYGGDFEQHSGDILTFAADYNSALQKIMEAGGSPKIYWIDYDWSLNDTAKK